jgi:hypothetical protein
MGLEGQTAVRTMKADRLQLLLSDVRKAVRTVQEARDEIDLIGSPEAADAASAGMKACGDATVLIVTQMDGFDRHAWYEFFESTEHALARFRDAAIRDLGIPKADRRRSSLKSLDWEEREELRQYVEGLVPDRSAPVREPPEN